MVFLGGLIKFPIINIHTPPSGFPYGNQFMVLILQIVEPPQFMVLRNGLDNTCIQQLNYISLHYLHHAGIEPPSR